MSTKDTPAQIRLDERQHVEKPLLDQLAGLGWEILDPDAKQHPGDSQPFYQLSHTHRMKSRSETCEQEDLAAIRRATVAFKRCRKLVDQWVDLALELFRLRNRLGLHSGQP